MIRKMKEEDLQQCGVIYAKAFPIEYWGIDWTTENATEYLQDFFEQGRFVGFVYEENTEVLGCIFALRKISGNKEEIYINEMAVLPERQGQGIGKQLLNAVKDYSKDKGLAGIVLYTSEYNNLISGSSAFSNTSLNIWKFMVHILLKPGLENFEHYFTSV